MCPIPSELGKPIPSSSQNDADRFLAGLANTDLDQIYPDGIDLMVGSSEHDSTGCRLVAAASGAQRSTRRSRPASFRSGKWPLLSFKKGTSPLPSPA